MENAKTLSEPLRITDMGKYELYDYQHVNEIALSGALLLQPFIENNLNATIKIIEKDSNREFDRLKLLAFVNPIQPSDDRIEVNGKFFNPKKHYLSIELKNSEDEINFMLYFSQRSK